MNSRDVILERISHALGDGHRPARVPRDYRGAHAGTDVDLVALFEDRLLDYRAAVRRCTADDLVPTIAAALHDRAARRVVVPAGLPVDWLPNAVLDHPTLSTDALDGLDGVLTGCAVAIAETGTVVLDHGPGQGRRALTLVPDLHLVVVRAEQIVRSVTDAVATLDPRRPMTWISGPSATSDIELTRVEGVHGPRQLEVIVVG